MFRKKKMPIAHRIHFEGEGIYEHPFEGSGYGVVFEDDGSTGYVYATNGKCDHIYDALHLYNSSDVNRLNIGEEAFVVWHPTLKKAGIFYHEMFQAIFDFSKQKACCRNGFPPPTKEWNTSHEWDEEMISGLEP